MNKFYTYIYYDETGLPYYVGKGSGRRATNKQAHSVPVPPEAQILKQFWTSEAEALEMEICFIDMYGRQDLGTGSLLNQNDGGTQPSRKTCVRGGLKAHALGIGIHNPATFGEGTRIRNKMYGNPATPESCAKGGRIGAIKISKETRVRNGLAAVKKGNLTRTSEQQAAAGRISGLKKSKEELNRMAHIRWHSNLGLVKEGCALCQ
jgi:hypothetical protein